MKLFYKINETATFLKDQLPGIPHIGIVLGSGLGEFADKLEKKIIFPFEKIPHFKKVSIKGHAGRLVVGNISNRIVAVLQGRYHYYEGHDISEVVFPIRVLCALGIKKLLLTNAAGGISPGLAPGDLMIIRDHINLMGVNPLRGEHDDQLGSRFPDMSQVYNEDLVKILAEEMQALGLRAKSGVYLALSGPSYETPAEIKMLSSLGADAVGMSTVPEAIVARQMKVMVAGISCITNLAAGISKAELDHKEVTETAHRVKGNFINLLKKTIPKL